MQHVKFLFLFLFTICLFSACQKDTLISSENTIDPYSPYVIKWETTVNGTVNDRQNNALGGATITVGNISTQSDENGRFSLTGFVNSNKASIQISKEGYFDNYPVFYPEQNQEQEIRAQLTERLMQGSVNNGNSVIALDNHAVNFSTSKFTNLDGSEYTGTVNVYMDYLDPTDAALNEFMPGDLVGINTENEEQALKSYGMLNVELEDGSGNPLQLDGEATLTMDVPAELMGDAPATIPLWYFDEVSGNWIEDGFATLEGNTYVGTVDHFTLWNCDAPFPLVTINGIINTNLDATTLTVRITTEDGVSRTTIPNTRGYFEGKVPQDQILTLEILDPCGTVVYTDNNVGPLSVDTNLGGFNIDAEIISLTVSGTAVDCDMNPITNGYVLINQDGGVSSYVSITDGSFSKELIVCSENEISVIAYDVENLKASTTYEYAFNTNLQTGQLTACEIDIPASGIYISGPDVNHFIPAASGITLGDSLTYTMNCLEDFGGGNKVIYEVTILDWNGDPNDPFLFLAISSTINGSPDFTYKVLQAVEQESAIIDDTPGGLFDVVFSNSATIEVADDQGQVTTYDDHNVRIIGIFN